MDHLVYLLIRTLAVLVFGSVILGATVLVVAVLLPICLSVRLFRWWASSRYAAAR
jgi:hypothetical protein